MTDVNMQTFVVEEYNDHPGYEWSELQRVTEIRIYEPGVTDVDLDGLTELVEREASDKGIVNYLLQDRRNRHSWGADSFTQEIIISLAAGLSGGSAPRLIDGFILLSKKLKDRSPVAEETSHTPVPFREDAIEATRDMLVNAAQHHAQHFGIRREDALVTETHFTDGGGLVTIESKVTDLAVRVEFENEQDLVKAERIKSIQEHYR